MDYEIELFLCAMVPKATVFVRLVILNTDIPFIYRWHHESRTCMEAGQIYYHKLLSGLDKLRSEILSCTEVYMLQIVCGQYKMGCSHVQSSVKSQEGMHTGPALTYCKQ